MANKETKNLAQKILSVMENVTSVQKKGYNDFQKYKYARESDYIEAIRPALIAHGVAVYPSLVSMRTEPLPKEGILTTVEMKFTLVNTDDTNDRQEIVIPGQGSDKGDKGVYKAITGAKKYFVANTFLIPTFDDPEASEYDEPKPTYSQTGLSSKATAAKTAVAAPVTKVAVDTADSEIGKKAEAPAKASVAAKTVGAISTTVTSSFNKNKTTTPVTNGAVVNGAAAKTATTQVSKGGW